MKNFFFSLLLWMTFQHLYAQNKDMEELKKLNRQWLDSYPKKDAATLNRIFADDFILISPKGAKMTKQDIINNLAGQEIVSINIDSMEVRLLTPGTGLITAYTTFVLKINDQNMTGQNCYQDVYIKRKGRWRAVSAHVTLLGMK